MEARLQGPCVGIDVSKRHWDMAVAGERRVLRFTQLMPLAWACFVAALEQLGPQLVCLEATGGYECALREALHQRCLPVSVVNLCPSGATSPEAGRVGQDGCDRRRDDRPLRRHVPSRAGRTCDASPEAVAVAPGSSAAGGALAHSREEPLGDEPRRCPGPPIDPAGDRILQPAVRASSIGESRNSRSADPAFRERLALLVSVPGVGAVTATGLLAELPELGTLNRGQAAKLVGLCRSTAIAAHSAANA